MAESGNNVCYKWKAQKRNAFNTALIKSLKTKIQIYNFTII